MVNIATANQDEKVAALSGIDNAISVLTKKLRSEGVITNKVANAIFTELHTRAAWTDIVALASLADQIWDLLSEGNMEADISRENRAEIRKQLLTYKFLLSRFKTDMEVGLAEAS